QRNGERQMNKFLRQAQELQAKLARAEKELGEAVIEVTSAGGAVTISIDGQQRLRSIKISPDLVQSDLEFAEDAVLTAVNEAITKSKDMAAKRLGSLTGMNIPGLM
ncbi:MAG: YbaB/EbfC family nucleoid-associated protein, partial [Chloroflexota bacterium]